MFILKKLFRKWELSKIDDFHQKLMDEAYELYRKHDKWSYEEFITNVPNLLSKLHLYAVVVGNLNYQVENGGWMQWYDNGYFRFASIVDEALENFGNYSKEANQIAQKVSNLLKDVIEHLEVLDQIESNRNYGDFEALNSLLDSYFYETPNINEISAELEDMMHDTSRDKEEIAQLICDEFSLVASFSDILVQVLDDEDVNYIAETVWEQIIFQQSEELIEELVEHIDNYNRQYYEINDKFMELFNEWLKWCYVNDCVK